jgi:putative glutamine amidotransferase
LQPEREATDFAILDLAEKKDIPVLGICFGVQSINVHRGGSLVQDIPSVVSSPLVHDEDDPNPPARHPVRLTEDSLIARLAGRSEIEVNSYHHQAVQRPGKDLRVVAVSPDGVVEAVEDTTGRFIVGVQWHPERGWRDDPASQSLFAALIEQARLRYNGAKR